MATQITINGTYKRANGAAESGVISFRLSTDLFDAAGNLVASRTPVSATLDGSGDFSVVLYATNDPDTTPTGAYYIATFTPSADATAVDRRSFELDAAVSPVRFEDLAEVEAGSPGLLGSFVAPGDDADTLGSGVAADGQILTADGAGGAAWEDAASGTSVVTVSGTSETLDGGDANTYRRYTNAAETTISLADGVASGVIITGRAVGAGGLVIQGNGSSTVLGAGTVAQGAEWSAISIGSDAWDVVGATASVFSPLDIAWHHAYWADAPDWTDPGDGNAVSQWDDASGNARHIVQATGGNQPLFRSSVANLNSKGGVDFDGTDDYLDVTFAADITDVTETIIVCNVDATSGGGILHSPVATKARAVVISGGNWALDGGTLQTGTSASTGAKALRAVWDATDTLDVNGTNRISANAGTEDMGGIRLGTNAGTSTPFNGQIAFVATKVGGLTTQERSDITDWISSYYGLTL